jgi:hypothetical protein
MIDSSDIDGYEPIDTCLAFTCGDYAIDGAAFLIRTDPATVGIAQFK